ncbi:MULTISPECIES: VENN motif pre-toxin domain-containing protein [Stenotrophomonas]|uniref:VENN motif pre-toxin domain-containing protein n=1 Tax=Stenotrophomonas TaxID=40323 RepID=UPI0021C5D930|nr:MULTISPECIES: VENN motif pre-toxin domain-containing protein [Stenotrophomonas]MCU1003243.1 VENN motif pre-toxin domain-containing protein [Stenotrophomonas maltophilia]MCU1069088.1 VENN motif pre-toxin domain-containing protein [Stenotrophomonas maltophilia]MCU1074383.1 VENN motif pre-toxin domain-containing protein [Stenotrophomonas maltophilia]MCU1138220.1 VENN motif pre-toxin domain-containing protein [Stenotrophomonas maltophilia]
MNSTRLLVSELRALAPIALLSGGGTGAIRMYRCRPAPLGALLAEANGGSAGSGALAAGGGELAAKVLTDTLFGGNPANLSPQQREALLALSQAVGALAGGLSGQDLAGIALNAGIAKNSVENNWLSRQEIALMESERAACGGKGEMSKPVRTP